MNSFLPLFKKNNKFELLVSIFFLTFTFLISLGNISNILAQEKEYDVKEIKDGVYVISSKGYNVMFLVTGDNVVVIDAPPSISDNILKAVSDTTNETIGYLVYSHAHKDHIGAAHILSAASRYKNNSTKWNRRYSQNERWS